MRRRIDTDLCVIGGGSAGLSVAAGAVQMGASTVLVERSAGRAEAVAAIILLGTAPLMWRLSISVMIGLPAVALAVAACAIVYGRDRAAPWRAVAAGLVFALSLQTKLFTAAALPAFLMMAYLADEAGPRGRRAATAATALAATVAGFVAIAWASPV